MKLNPLQTWSQEIAAKREKLEAGRLMLEAAKTAATKRKAAMRLSDAHDLIGAFNLAYTPDEWMIQAGYDQHGNSFRHPNSQTGNFSATVKANSSGVLRVNTLSSSDPLYSGGQGASDAFDVFTLLVHGGDRDAALRDAGDNLLTIGSVSYNKAVQREHMQRQAEQQQQQKPNKAQPPPREPVFTGDKIDLSNEPDFPPFNPDGLSMNNGSANSMPPFPENVVTRLKRVSLADVITNPPEDQEYIWGEYIPVGEQTLLAAHGGVGKSMFCLELAVHAVMGAQYLGLQTRKTKTLFFSAEDNEKTIRRRVARICIANGFDPGEVDKGLVVIDATDTACLFQEVVNNWVKVAVPTEHYQSLLLDVEEESIGFLIVDNASDVFSGDPQNRTMVTQFTRALVRLVRGNDGAVLLLAHVNKVTAKAARYQTDAEGYADSAAWHNASRSRLFLNTTDDVGGLVLLHQKNNFGRRQEPLIFRFRDNGEGFCLPDMELLAHRDTEKAARLQKAKEPLLRLIREFYERGEWISPSSNSPTTNAHAILKGERGYPFKDNRDGKSDCTIALRECERGGLLFKESYKKLDRHDGERWALTEKGIELSRWSSIVSDELDG